MTTETPKLCPFKFTDDTYRDYICLQEKCAMWREGLDPTTAMNIQAQVGDRSYDVHIRGYCGLAGKP